MHALFLIAFVYFLALLSLLAIMSSQYKLTRQQLVHEHVLESKYLIGMMDHTLFDISYGRGIRMLLSMFSTMGSTLLLPHIHFQVF